MFQRAKKIGCGNEDALDEVNASSFVPECVQDFLDYPSDSIGMKVLKEDFKEDDVKEEPMDEELAFESEETVYEVERIVGKKEVKGQTLYHIKWKGFDKVKDNTWEPADNLDCTDKINKFEAKQKIQSKLGCSMCGFSSKDESIVTKHKESPHDFVCSECDLKFTQPTDLYEHKLIKHTFDDKETEYFEEKEGARKQYRKICKICGVENRLPDNKKHNSIHHNVSSLFIYPCPVCWEWFETEDGMKKHTEFHIPGDDSNIYCQVCNMKIRAQTNGSTSGGQRAVTIDGVEGCRTQIGQQTLDEHMKIHIDETRTTCGECGKKCKDHKAYTHHIRTHDEPKHACEICGKAFRKISEVEEHVKVLHTKELEFRCDQCFKSYPSRDSLKGHVKKVHNFSRNFQCEKCPKAFKANKDLVSHDKRVHLKLRPFACSFAGCGIAFATNVDRGIHERIHTGEKPYKCEECGAAFRKWQHWKKHEMLHTGEKPFKCQHCGKGFIQKCNMNMHEVKCSMHS